MDFSNLEIEKIVIVMDNTSYHRLLGMVTASQNQAGLSLDMAMNSHLTGPLS